MVEIVIGVYYYFLNIKTLERLINKNEIIKDKKYRVNDLIKYSNEKLVQNIDVSNQKKIYNKDKNNYTYSSMIVLSKY